MKLSELQNMVQDSEARYKKIDKSSFEELTRFMETFSKIYVIFQTRERYKKANEDISPVLKAFFDKYDSELALLSQTTLDLANSIDSEFRKFTSPENPSLFGKFFSFFVSSNAASSKPSASPASSEPSEPSVSRYCGFSTGFLN